MNVNIKDLTYLLRQLNISHQAIHLSHNSFVESYRAKRHAHTVDETRYQVH